MGIILSDYIDDDDDMVVPEMELVKILFANGFEFKEEYKYLEKELKKRIRERGER